MSVTAATPDDEDFVQKREQLRRLEADLVGNAMMQRSDMIRKLMDPRRNVYEECGYPTGWLTPNLFQDLYDREAVGARVVEVLPKECWQVQPGVYEDDDPEVVTPFEEAWDGLSKQLAGEASWYEDEKGNPVWDYLLRADILSGIGQYGTILLGIDDNADLQQPVEGMIEENSQPKAKTDKEGKPIIPDDPEEAKAVGKKPLPKPKPPVGNGIYSLTTNAGPAFGKKSQVPGRPAPASAAPTKPTRPGAGPPPPPDTPSTDLPADKMKPDPQGVKAAGTYPAEIDAGTNDGTEMDSPGDPVDGAIHKLVYMRVFPESQAQVVQYEGNRSSPRFGQPTMYAITFSDPTREPATGIGLINETRYVHWTRVVHVADTHHQASSSEWAAHPRMKPVLNNVLGCQKLGCGSAEMFWRGAFPGLSFETHPQLGGDVKINPEKMRDQAENYMNSLQRYLVLMGMTAKTLSPTVSDPTPFIDKQIELICIKLGIPVRIFKGSERGELSSDQDDGTWNDRIRERQNDYVTPKIIVRFVNRLIALGVLPEPEKFTVEWPDLDAQSEEQKAAVGLQRTQALAAYISGGIEPIMTPLDFLTKIMGFEEEEAQSILDAAEEAVASGEGIGQIAQAGIDQQAAAIDAGVQAHPDDVIQGQVDAADKLAKTPGGVHVQMPGAAGGGFPPGKGAPPGGGKMPLGAKPAGTPAPPGGSPPSGKPKKPVANYDPSQPRAEDGKFGSGAAKDRGHGPDRDLTGAVKKSLNGRQRVIDKTTTHEGVKKEHGKDLAPEENKQVLSWHDGMTQVGKNAPNGRLPKESHSADYDATERGALQKYSYLNDRVLNGVLRGDKSKVKESPYNENFYDEMHSALQSAFAKTPPLAKPVTVVRGMKLDEAGLSKFMDKMKSAMSADGHVQFDGYTSTAAPGGILHKLGLGDPTSSIPEPFRGNVALKINAVHGIDMGPHSQLPGEAELLLNHASKFKVKKITKKGGTWHVELDQQHHGAVANVVFNVDVGDSDPAGVDDSMLKFYEDHPDAAGKWVDTNADFVKTGDDLLPGTDQFATNEDSVTVTAGGVGIKLTLNDAALAADPDKFMDQLAANMHDMLERLSINGDKFIRDRMGKFSKHAGLSGEHKETAISAIKAHERDPVVAPPPGPSFSPNVEEHGKHGITKTARVGVPGDSVPPPPKVPELPNLTTRERRVETKFRDAFHKNPDGMANDFLSILHKTTKPGDPLTFGTDDAKVLSKAWHNDGISKEDRSKNRATLNLPLHQVANAIAKKAFLKHLDTLKHGDEVLVTVGGCGAGKGYALKNVPQALEMKKKAKAVWDSAGDQNATENPWIQKELEKRGLKGNYVYVHADPVTQWAHPEKGVVSRANNPEDGRMVDAKVFADSYALGAKNHQAFYEANKDNKNANFVFLENLSTPKLLPGIPESALSLDRNALAKFAVEEVQKGNAPAHVKRGATSGARIWGMDD